MIFFCSRFSRSFWANRSRKFIVNHLYYIVE
nr:MAG TPA: hypothetical protein [Caudoviricetes sp.]